VHGFRAVEGSILPGGVEGDLAGVMRETLLPNGIRVMTEAIPGVRSVTAGVWIRSGAAHELAEHSGASHLLEHLVFKGTERRDSREIALSLERLGGSLDAFTSREHTSYQARVLPEHLSLALDVLADIVRNPLLREEDVDLEREVVLEELAGVEDDPDDLVFELHGEVIWEGHPYGRSILGTRETLEGLTAGDLRDLHRARYLNGCLVVAGAGHLDHDRFVAEVERLFGDLPGGPPPTVPKIELVKPSRDLVQVQREGSQSHLVFGVRTPRRQTTARFPLVLISAAFGGGMGSRLFQKIREELALGYSVYSFQSFYLQAGIAGVYLGTRPDWREKAMDALREEFANLARDGLGETEFRETKDQVKGQILLSLESPNSRLYRLAGFALYDQPARSLDDLLREIESVTREDVAEVASLYFHPDRQTVLQMGPDLG
jgi:predicted Zn-dependent peptidase